MQEQMRKPEGAVAVQSATTAPTVEVKEAKPPKGMTAEDQAKIEQDADKAVQELQAAEGGHELELADKIANVGMKAQRSAGTELDLLQERMGKLTGSKDQNAAQLGQDIEQLKAALERINPSSVQQEFLFNLLRVIPFLGPKMVRTLKTVAARRQTVRQLVEYIEESLTKGRDGLVHDNAQLALLYKQLEAAQVTVQKNAFFAELLAKKLEAVMEKTEDPQKKSRMQNVLFRVYVRAQDLRAMEEAYEQFFVSITITRENNSLLIASIERMLSLGMNIVTVALAIQVALAHQRDVMVAVRETRDFIGKVLAQNANMIRQHVKEIGDIYKEPIIAIKQLEEAHNNLIEAMNEIDRLKTEGIAAAKDNIAKLKIMSEDMRNRRSGTQAAELVSIEVGDLPTRPVTNNERPKL